MSWFDKVLRQGRREVHTEISMGDEYDEAASILSRRLLSESGLRMISSFDIVFSAEERVWVEILLNGEKRKVDSGLTLAKLLESLEIRSGSVAIEHNEKVVPRRDLEHFALNAGDKVEIVRFVGGG